MGVIGTLLQSLWKVPEGRLALAVTTGAAATLCIAVASLYASNVLQSRHINDLEREHRIESVSRERECDSVQRVSDRRCDSIQQAGYFAREAELRVEIDQLRKDYKDAITSTSQAARAQTKVYNRIKKATKQIQK